MGNDIELVFPGFGTINFTKLADEAEDLVNNITPNIIKIMAGVWTDVEAAEVLAKDIINLANVSYRAADDVITRLEEDFALIQNNTDDIDKQINEDIEFIETNYILILSAIGIISIFHIIIYWACQRLSLSVYFGWALTLITGGIGFFYLVYRAAVYDENYKMEEMIKKDKYTFQKTFTNMILIN